MQSFRTELEGISTERRILVEKDLVDLEAKIYAFRNGTLHEEKFRSLRLARGVYGQRQPGVQMIRIKLPYGKISTKQLRKIAAIGDEYSNGNLHLTTRQDIQIHHVSLERTPELWAKLEQDDITLREACGNTVRNIVASPEAGITPGELFDVTPYAHAAFSYFLRKPFCQELGRKFKITFSHTAEDTATTFIHDMGFIPARNAAGENGFKVLIGGGLGAQPFLAQTLYDFYPANDILHLLEGTLRVFDRHGERASRHKARIKYLIGKIGIEGFAALLAEEQAAIVPANIADYFPPQQEAVVKAVNKRMPDINDTTYLRWKSTNTFAQKQPELYGVYVKVQLGNISTDQARLLAEVIDTYADHNDLRLTVNQNFLLRNVHESVLPHLFDALAGIDLVTSGAGSVADITACPGTDTCNLAISNSTQLSVALENVIADEYPELLYNKDIQIKISGCMNACGQHSLAQIGFHGSSFKLGEKVIPAVQVLLGGGKEGNGDGRISEKVIKVATKRAPDVLRYLFDDLAQHAEANETFNQYYDRRSKDYFYQLLKPLGNNATLADYELSDWGKEELFQTAIGVGECAGVVVDLVATLFYEAEDKIQNAQIALAEGRFGDSAYYSYASFIQTAKGWILENSGSINTHHGVIRDFDNLFANGHAFSYAGSFSDLILQINKQAADQAFAANYLAQAQSFLAEVRQLRERQPITQNA